MSLQLKKYFLHKSCSLPFIFLVLYLPFCYWFEVFVVLPTIYAPSFSFWYILYLSWFTFLFISIVSNLTYVVLTDCSIKGIVMPSNVLPSWKYCDICESVTPPRSWHCETCETCILKRDHHCHFSGCCIGHKNQRFFLIFLLYMAIATVHVTIFNAYFIFKDESISLWLLIRLFFPLAVLSFGVDVSLQHCYVLIFVVDLLGMLACVLLLIYHTSSMIRGAVMYERSHNIFDYDLGSLKLNIVQVFGDKWYLSWISPFIKSRLPSDGIHWENAKLKSVKTRSLETYSCCLMSTINKSDAP